MKLTKLKYLSWQYFATTINTHKSLSQAPLPRTVGNQAPLYGQRPKQTCRYQAAGALYALIFLVCSFTNTAPSLARFRLFDFIENPRTQDNQPTPDKALPATKEKSNSNLKNLLAAPMSLPLNITTAILSKSPLNFFYSGLKTEESAGTGLDMIPPFLSNGIEISQSILDFRILSHDGKNKDKIQKLIDLVHGRILVHSKIGKNILSRVLECKAKLIRDYMGVSPAVSHSLQDYCRDASATWKPHDWVAKAKAVVGEFPIKRLPSNLKRKFSLLLTKSNQWPYDSWTHKNITYIVIQVDEFNELKLDVERLTHILAHEMAIYFDSLSLLGTRKSRMFLDQMTDPKNSPQHLVKNSPRFKYVDTSIESPAKYFLQDTNLKLWMSLNSPSIAVILAELRAFQVEKNILQDLQQVGIINSLPNYPNYLQNPLGVSEKTRFNRIKSLSEKMLPFNVVLLAHSRLYFHQRVEHHVTEHLADSEALQDLVAQLKDLASRRSSKKKPAEYIWLDIASQLHRKTLTYGEIPLALQSFNSVLVELPQEARKTFESDGLAGVFSFTGLKKKTSFLLQFITNPEHVTPMAAGPINNFFGTYDSQDYYYEDINSLQNNAIISLQKGANKYSYPLLKFLLSPQLSRLQVNSNTGPRPRIM